MEKGHLINKLTKRHLQNEFKMHLNDCLKFQISLLIQLYGNFSFALYFTT